MLFFFDNFNTSTAAAVSCDQICPAGRLLVVDVPAQKSGTRACIPAPPNPIPAESEREVPEAAPRTGVTRVGDVENTMFVLVVPVVPAALPIRLSLVAVEVSTTFSLTFIVPELKVLVPVTVSVLPKVIAVPLAAGPVKVVPSISVRVADVAGAVKDTLLIDVAEATPKTGVTSVGVSLNTAKPDPDSSLSTPRNSAEVVAANTDNLLATYATVPPVPKATEELSVPVSVRVFATERVLRLVMVNAPVEAVSVRPLILVAVATPNTGVTNVGEVEKTMLVLVVPVVPAALVMKLSFVAVEVNTTFSLTFIVPLLKVLTPVTVSVLPRVIKVPVDAGPVTVVPSIIVRVALEAGAVMATLLTLVAVATPSTGVMRVGVLARTKAPVPVGAVTPAK